MKKELNIEGLVNELYIKFDIHCNFSPREDSFKNLADVLSNIWEQDRKSEIKDIIQKYILPPKSSKGKKHS